MNEVRTLNNIGNQGLSLDSAPWTLPPEFITYGRNFRIFAGSIQSTGGRILWDTAPTAFNPGYLFQVGSTSGTFWMIAGRDKVYAFDGTTWSDITSTAGYASIGVDDEFLWNACLLGQIAIINNPQANPEYWAPVSAGQILQPLPFDATNSWFDMGFSAQIMRSHRTFLFALNLFEGATEFPDSYRWSHPADINGLPATWDETDEAFLAGKSSLGGDGGTIIDGKSLRDAFCIYSESGIDILDYTSDEFVWRRRELSSTAGLLAKNAIVEIKGVHFLLSDGDIIRNDGNKIESIAHNRIGSDIRSKIDSNNYNKSYAIRHDNRKEIWFCIPETGASFPTLAYIYNWKDDSFAIRDLPSNTVYADSGSQSFAVSTWATVAGNWNNISRKWSGDVASAIFDSVVAIDRDAETLYFLDSNPSDEDYNFVIERDSFPLLGDRQVTTITRIYPHIDSEVPVNIEFGSQDYPKAPIRWKPVVVFDPLTQRKVDIRTTGELHCWRISALGKSNISMSGMTIEYVKAGLR